VEVIVAQFKPGDQIWDAEHRRLLGVVAESGAVYDYDRHLVGRVDPTTGVVMDAYDRTILARVNRDRGTITDAYDRKIIGYATLTGQLLGTETEELLGRSEAPLEQIRELPVETGAIVPPVPRREVRQVSLGELLATRAVELGRNLTPGEISEIGLRNWRHPNND
jgi:hypothetical protein